MAIETQRYIASQLIESGVLVINDGFRAKNSQLNEINGVPFARAGNINNGFDFSEADLVNEEEVSKAGIKVSQPGDVVFTSKGTVGRFGFVTQDTQTFVYSPQLCFWRVVDESVINPRFLYYWMHSSEFLHQVYALKGQTDMADYVSLKDQRAMEIRLPDRKTQDDIAKMIGSFDKKIELNRQTNQTLESMAQALFKSWFVDFDPVIDNALAAGNDIPEPLAAKAAARRALREQGTSNAKLPHTLPDNIRQLFPSRFQFTEELGWIPEGWERSLISEFGDVVCGKTPSKNRKDFYGRDVPFIKIPDMHGGAFVIQTADGLSFEGAMSQPKKMLPAGSVCVSCIATVGKVVIAHTECQTNQQINSIIPLHPNFTYFLYFMMAQLNDHFHDLASGGSATLNMNTSTFSKVGVLKPTDVVLREYNRLVSPWFDSTLKRLYESEALTSLRDSLLPKLLSGELRIPEVEQAAEEMLA